jgi:hypothetical protein
MRARLTKFGVALAAIAALAVGGSAYVSAAGKNAPPQPPPAVQSEPVQSEQGAAADTDNVQQGDQSAPDNSAEAQGEGDQASSESGPSDGPGGYADSNANADTQQQGEH